MTNLDSIFKSRDIPLSTKVRLVKAMVFPVVMYGCKSWTVKKAEHWRIDAFELWCWRTLESPLACKEIQPVHSEGDQLWDFFGGNDVKAETPVLWPPHVKSWLIGEDPDAGRDWRQEEKGTTEAEMAWWHHWLDGCESGWTPGVGDRQGGLACCDSWGCKESDTTEQLNWTELTEMKDSMPSWSVILCSYRVTFNVDTDHNDNQYICVPLCILICFNAILFLLTFFFFFFNWARSCLMSKQLIQDYESKSVSVQRLSIHLQVAFILPLIYLITIFFLF